MHQSTQVPRFAAATDCFWSVERTIFGLGCAVGHTDVIFPMAVDYSTYNHERDYEKNQRANPIVAFLHRVRYGHLIRVFDELSAKVQGRPLRVLEIGTGFGKAFRVLNVRYDIQYAGIELNTYRANESTRRYRECKNFTVVNDSAANFDAWEVLPDPDVVIALETMEHIPEQDVLSILRHIANMGACHFLCSVPIEIGPSLAIKNLGSALMQYNRHWSYTWRETVRASLYHLHRIPPHRKDHKGFDYRWLAHSIRYYLQLVAIWGSPFKHVPLVVSPSVFFVARTRKEVNGGIAQAVD